MCVCTRCKALLNIEHMYDMKRVLYKYGIINYYYYYYY